MEATLVTGGFFYVFYSTGWAPGESTDPGSPLHGAYFAATTMTFAGITACQVGTAFAARTSRASLREIGIFSNRLLLWGILFELAFAAAVIYLPPLQEVFGTNADRVIYADTATFAGNMPERGAPGHGTEVK